MTLLNNRPATLSWSAAPGVDYPNLPAGIQTARLVLGGGWTARVLLRPREAAPIPGMDGAVMTATTWTAWLRPLFTWHAPADRRNVLKTSSTTLVTRVAMPLEPGRTLDVVCKRRVSRHWHKRLLAMIRVSRPRRTWRRAQALLNAGIPTARPLAILERRRMGFLVDSLMITEYLRHAVDLEAFLTVRLRDVDPQVQRRLKPRLADGLAAFVLQLQRAGFIHRDLKALNVIVQWDPEGDASPRISLVDLDGLRQSAAAAARGHLRMLMRLNVSVDAFRRVSLADRARVLHRYLARAGRPRSEFKLLWRRLADMSERKRAIRTRQQERAFKKYGRF